MPSMTTMIIMMLTTLATMSRKESLLTGFGVLWNGTGHEERSGISGFRN